MSALRPIDISNIAGVEPPADLGPAPVLQWCSISDLVVDPRYQRPIQARNRRQIKAIAAAFSWSKFSSVVVAPVAGGKFAIIDGQHRCMAAALIGIDEVPVQMVIADAAEQARAFSAINGQMTKVTSLQRHKADLAARDETALELEEVCRIAGVTILSYPVPVELLKAGETLSVASLRRAFERFGRETLITALQCITETSNNYPGALKGQIIMALCDAIYDAPAWRDAGERLLRVFDDHDLLTIFESVKSERRWHLTTWARTTLRREIGEPIGRSEAA